jgi:cephalosporin hydroxylase
MIAFLKPLAKKLYAGVYGSPRFQRFVARHFHRAYYQKDDTTFSTHWLGYKVLKCPFDLWMYQEILHEVKPDLVVETGTAYGGSAYFMACIMDSMGKGEIVTVDIAASGTPPTHPRITYLTGSSTDPAIVAEVHRRAAGKKTVMVSLDSDHAEAHVTAEIQAYHSLVTDGSYMIVEDTHIGHPVPPFSQTGPMESVEQFLKANREFEADPWRERLMMSFHYNGYLKRQVARK